MKRIVCLTIIAALVLCASGPAGELELKELVALCGDQKCDPTVFLNPVDPVFKEMEFLRQVAGPASMDEAKWVAVRDAAASNGVKYVDIDLFAHVCTNDVGCGGLNASKVIAEGVEEYEQARILTREGCKLVQGFLYSPPVGAESMGHLLDNAPGLQNVM